MQKVDAAVIEPDFVADAKRFALGDEEAGVPLLGRAALDAGNAERPLPMLQIARDGQLQFGGPFLVSIAGLIVDGENPRKAQDAAFGLIEAGAVEFGPNQIGRVGNIEHRSNFFDAGHGAGIVAGVGIHDQLRLAPGGKVGAGDEPKEAPAVGSRNVGDFGQRHPQLALPIVVAGDDVGAGADPLFAVPRPVQPVGRDESVISLIGIVGRMGFPVPLVGDHLVAASRIGVVGVLEDVGQARAGGDGVVLARNQAFDCADERLLPMDAVGAGGIEGGIAGEVGTASRRCTTF